MAQKRRRNPKMPNIGNILKLGILGAAGYGGYKIYESVKGNNPPPTDTPTTMEACRAAGGIWVPSPSFQTGPTLGQCIMPKAHKLYGI